MTKSERAADTTSITEASIADLNTRYQNAHSGALQSERDKLLVIVSGFALIMCLGGPNGTGVQPFYDARGIKPAGQKKYNLAAQLVTGRNVTTTIQGAPKKQARNIVDRAADLMAALGHFNSDGTLASLTDEQIVDWIIDVKGGLNGVVKAYKDALRGDADADEPKAVVDLEAHRAALESAGIKLAITEPLIAPEPSISLHQRDGSDLIVLPLAGVPADLLDRLRPYLPTADANAAPSLKLWGSIAEACQLFDRTNSRVPLRADQARYEGEAKAPSRPIIRLVSSTAISIAASRVDVGMVITVEITDEVLRLSNVDLPGHLNGTATNALTDHLTSPVSRASFDSAGVEHVDGKTWLKFKGKEGVKDFRVRLLPMAAFGLSVPQWTLAVASSFKPTATATIAADGGFPETLVKFADKVGASRHRTTVAVEGGNLSLALGESEAQVMSGEGKGNASVPVSSLDFAKVIAFGAQLRPTTVTVALDSKGMVAFAFYNDQARYTAHIPALNTDGAAMTALLDLVEKPTA